MDMCKEILSNCASAPGWNKQQLIDHHLKHVDSRKRETLGYNGSLTFDYSSAMPNIVMRKPEAGNERPKNLNPIFVSDLLVGTTHRGRVFRGKIITPCSVLVGIMTILEDERGDAVQISVYNLLDPNLPMGNKWSAAANYFKKGQWVSINEPFFKQYGDGTFGIRVDDPSELIIANPGEQDARSVEDVKKDAKNLFLAKDFSAASKCYTQAIKLLDLQAQSQSGERLLSPILCNASAACLKLNDAAPTGHADKVNHASFGLLLGVTTLAIDPNYDKAQARIDAAIKIMKEDAVLATDSSMKNTKNEMVGMAISRCFDLILERQENLIIPEHEDLVLLRKQGNSLFAKGQFEASLDLYLGAVLTFSRTYGVSTLLSNRSITELKLGNDAKVLMDATAALVLDMKNVKAHYHLGSALQNLGLIEQAKNLISRSLSVCPSAEPLKELLKKINSQPIKPVTLETLQAISIKYQEDLSAVQSCNSVAEIVMFDKKMSIEKAKTEIGLDSRPPLFHMEYSANGFWPVLCDVPTCQLRLSLCYEYSRGSGCMFTIGRKSMNSSLMDKAYKEDLLKRLGTNHPEAIKWHFNCQQQNLIGNIFPKANALHKGSYNTKIIHPFSNAPQRKEIFTANTTVVSVGFVDLGILMAGEVAGEGVLKWVGYEANPYNVAKTAVIVAMMFQKAPVDSIVQVWYSTTWSHTTLSAFKTAVKHLLNKTVSQTPRILGLADTEVRALLQHWLVSQVSLASARLGWLQCTPNYAKWKSIGNFKLSCDRFALCSYSLTGSVLEAEVGSLVMFSFPPNFSKEVEKDPCIFQPIPFHELITERKTSSDIVEAAVNHYRSRIQRLQSSVISGRVVIDIISKAVKPEDSATIRDIACLDPYSITWNNVPDYIVPKDFHKLARECSGSNTIHHSYTMNWPYAVFGASFVDFIGNSEFLFSLIKISEDMEKIHNQVLKCDYLLLSPPIYDPKNFIESVLHVQSRQHWTDAFFAAADLEDVKRQAIEVQPPLYDIFQRGSSTMFYTFTYDPEIKFNENQGNF